MILLALLGVKGDPTEERDGGVRDLPKANHAPPLPYSCPHRCWHLVYAPELEGSGWREEFCTGCGVIGHTPLPGEFETEKKVRKWGNYVLLTTQKFIRKKQKWNKNFVVVCNAP